MYSYIYLFMNLCMYLCILKSFLFLHKLWHEIGICVFFLNPLFESRRVMNMLVLHVSYNEVFL